MVFLVPHSADKRRGILRGHASDPTGLEPVDIFWRQRLSGRFQRNRPQLDATSAVPRDDDLFAAQSAVDELGQPGLGLRYAVLAHE